MLTVSVNLVAVLVAALAAMVIGSVWYSPLLFVKVWMKELGMTEKDCESGKKDMPKAMAGQFIASLVTAYVLAHFVAYTGSTTPSAGAHTGFWIWLGFLATGTASAVFFERKSWTYFAITAGCGLVTLLIMGAILATWR